MIKYEWRCDPFTGQKYQVKVTSQHTLQSQTQTLHREFFPVLPTIKFEWNVTLSLGKSIK